MHLLRPTLVAGLLATLLAASGCGSDGSTGTKGGTPTRIDVSTPLVSTGAAGSVAGTFAVKVVDAVGVGVAGVTVSFSSTGAASVSPSSAVTDASGVASTQVALSTTIGAATVRAAATGVASAATSSITVIAGAASKLVVTPKALRFLNLGDTSRVTVAAQDQFGNPVGASVVTYTAVDGTLVSVDATGLVRVLRQPGTTFVISTSSGKSDTTAITVLAAGASVCTGLAAAAPMSVGDTRTFTGTQYGCVSGTASGAEFAMVAFNSSPDTSSLQLSASVTGSGLAAVPSTFAYRGARRSDLEHARVRKANIA